MKAAATSREAATEIKLRPSLSMLRPDGDRRRREAKVRAEHARPCRGGARAGCGRGLGRGRGAGGARRSVRCWAHGSAGTLGHLCAHRRRVRNTAHEGGTGRDRSGATLRQPRACHRGQVAVVAAGEPTATAAARRQAESEMPESSARVRNTRTWGRVRRLTKILEYQVDETNGGGHT